MAYLINRNPSGRLLCLHGLLQYVNHHWGDGPYEIRNFKFDATKSPDIHDFSPCASFDYGFKSCVYLDNPASLAGCGLVNSLVEDSQKSKSASDVFNALDGLGFTSREGNKASITGLGRLFVDTSRDSPEWEKIARIGAQNYGPFAGLLFLASRLPQGTVWYRKQIQLGFAETGEEVDFQGEVVTLSTGSQSDTMTRSRSSIISWGVATGFFIPEKPTRTPENLDAPAQVAHREYLMGPKWGDGFFNSDLVFQEDDSVVERPLSYHQLVKSIRSLRENGQAIQRQASLRWESVVKNRRLAIAHMLHQSAVLAKPLNFSAFVSELSLLPDFVVNKSEMESTMISELGNAFVIGTPFTVVSEELLQGRRRVDLEVLNTGAEPQITEQLMNLTSNSSLFGS